MKNFILGLSMLPVLAFSLSNEQFKFLSISDIHLNIEQAQIMQINPAGYNSNNDMDYYSFNKLMTAVKNTTAFMTDKPYFVIYLGDMVGHSDSSFNRIEYVKKNENVIFKRLLHDFPSTPIINIFGNNDSVESNYGDFQHDDISPFTIAESSGFKNGFLSTGLICGEVGKNNKFPCLLKQFREEGYFSVLLKNNLMLVGLNSVMFSPNHHEKKSDFEKQFQFLKSELQLARRKHIRVILAMHIPVGNNVYDGSSFWKSYPKAIFLKIVSEYRKEISAILVGHTHMEEFNLIKILNEKTLGQYFTAGLSTSHGNSPSLKVFIMRNEKNKWYINDYMSYQFHGCETYFTKYYSFSNEYCKNSDSKKNINDCLYSVNFDDALQRYTVNNPNYLNYLVKAPSEFFILARRESVENPDRVDCNRSVNLIDSLSCVFLNMFDNFFD